MTAFGLSFFYLRLYEVKLINNRIQYLNEQTFTASQLLQGFKISGIHYGYSHFNPLLFKYICEKYRTKICYDPCGGWGHHILGALNIDKYIYNDLSTHTYNNVLTMCNDFTFFMNFSVLAFL